MENIVTAVFSTAFLFSLLRVSTPLVLAAMGGLIAERSGAINIGLEGLMLFGAFTALVFSSWTHNPWLALLMAMISCVIFSALLAIFHLHLKADIILAGIALNILALGLTSFLMFLITGIKGYSSGVLVTPLPDIELPFIKNIPVISSLSGHSIVTYLALASVICAYIYLYKTVPGLRLRSVGSNPAAGQASGVSIMKIQWAAILISGALCGLAGAQLSISTTKLFVNGMVQGRGFIAFAAVLLGDKKPFRVFLGALIFGAFDTLSITFQVLSKFPSQFVYIIPYVATLVALVVYGKQAQSSRIKAFKAMEQQDLLST
ncbi:MAG: ABC transporter permease [Firmicutes bacterium]|nr:ABC transporter permease [Bacillota bacterium]